ncbi:MULTISPECIES: hypothetical protein [unclassified Campylobacter]|nr:MULTISPECIES: hypothetical protein [unclassified Campylobacter]NDJ26550.1 hypothetical protein [Campylobacter sp. MIT 19-121]
MDKASFKIPSQMLSITKRSTLNIPNNTPLTQKVHSGYKFKHVEFKA